VLQNDFPDWIGTNVIEDLIIDAGMHRGEDTEFYLKKGFRVVAIDANPDLCQQVGQRLSAFVDTGQLTIVNAAIVEYPGPITFYINTKVTDWSTTQKSWVKRNELMGATSQEITVQGVTFAKILKDHGIPYFLKIDIEGNDLLCLEALVGQSSQPHFISIESEKLSWKKLRREFELFRELGFSQFKVVNQIEVPEQVCPTPAREGLQTAHSFPFGASGLFGEEAPGTWMSAWRALLLYRKIFLKYQLVGNYGVLPNLHKRIQNKPRLKRFVHPGWYDTHAKRICPSSYKMGHQSGLSFGGSGSFV
jgi:FkbM family methyltransferase